MILSRVDGMKRSSKLMIVSIAVSITNGHWFVKLMFENPDVWKAKLLEKPPGNHISHDSLTLLLRSPLICEGNRGPLE